MLCENVTWLWLANYLKIYRRYQNIFGSRICKLILVNLSAKYKGFIDLLIKIMQLSVKRGINTEEELSQRARVHSLTDLGRSLRAERVKSSLQFLFDKFTSE